MTDKPKRKRSERVAVHNKRRLRWLVFLYSLFLLPVFAKIGLLLPVLIPMFLGIGVLAIGSYFINLLSKLENSLMPNTIIFVIAAVSALLAGILFVIPAWVGLLMINIMFPTMGYMTIFTVPVMLVLSVEMLILSFDFTLALQIQIIALMDSFRHRAIETERQKNDNSSRLSDELEEPDISLELLAESESAKQAQR